MEYEKQSLRSERPETPRPNRTGIPVQMKREFERKSGLPFDDVRVHYNSALPARLGALAYTQGTQVFIGPGQERHLGHELGHVIQQKQGQVQATGTVHGIKVNTSPLLERDADLLAGQRSPRTADTAGNSFAPCEVVQMAPYSTADAMWKGITGGAMTAEMVEDIVQKDPTLHTLYNDAVAQLGNCTIEFFQEAIDLNSTAVTKNGSPSYIVRYCPFPKDDFEKKVFVSYIIHELAHVAVSHQYNRPIPEDALGPATPWINMHLPEAKSGDSILKNGLTEGQRGSLDTQHDILFANMEQLEYCIQNETALKNRLIKKNKSLQSYLLDRVHYGGASIDMHYETVLGDMLYILIAEDLTQTRTFLMVRQMLAEANARRNQPPGKDDDITLPEKILESDIPQISASPEVQGWCNLI